MEQFQRWLLDQIHSRNLSPREASLGAGLSHGAISRYLSGSRPAALACKKLADYFEVPAEMVLYLAGYVSAPPDHDLFLKQVSELTQGLTAAEKAEALDLLRVLRKRRPAR